MGLYRTQPFSLHLCIKAVATPTLWSPREQLHCCTNAFPHPLKLINKSIFFNNQQAIHEQWILKLSRPFTSKQKCVQFWKCMNKKQLTNMNMMNELLILEKLAWMLKGWQCNLLLRDNMVHSNQEWEIRRLKIS